MDQRQARDDLAMIRRLIEDGRREVVDRGRHFMIWGVLTAIGASLTYAYVLTQAVPQPALVWGVVLVVGWLASFWVGWRDGRSARARTFARRLLTAVWVASAVTLTLLGVAGILGGALEVRSLPGLMSVVIGAPVMATSVLTGQRWLAGVAAGWWLGGGIMLFVTGPYALLLMATMSLLLMALPGVVLNGMARRQPAGNGGPAADPA